MLSRRAKKYLRDASANPSGLFQIPSYHNGRDDGRRATVQVLVAMGLMEPQGQGWWRITQDGRDFLESP